MLNRKDGLYIARYKLYQTCNRIEITVKRKNEHLAESPYVINDAVYSEDCECPVKDVSRWLNDWQCTVPAQIASDLNHFPRVNWDLIRDKVSFNF